MTNCPLCGVHLSLEEARDRKSTILFPNGVEVVICEQCGKKKKELQEKLAKTSPKQIKMLTTKTNEPLVEAILREQIPAQPVVPVGPVTIEQKVAALNDKLAQIEKQLSYLYGLMGVSMEEVETALTWKLR